jgi:hypothetical protein
MFPLRGNYQSQNDQLREYCVVALAAVISSSFGESGATFPVIRSKVGPNNGGRNRRDPDMLRSVLRELVISRFIERCQPDHGGAERFKVTAAGRIKAAANLEPRKADKKPPTAEEKKRTQGKL